MPLKKTPYVQCFPLAEWTGRLSLTGFPLYFLPLTRLYQEYEMKHFNRTQCKSDLTNVCTAESL